MPTFQDPSADEAREAVRALTYATRRFNDPAQMYDVIGNLISAVHSLQRVLDQVASAHVDQHDRAFTDSGDHAAGVAHADRAADALHAAAQHLRHVENDLDLASRHSGQIAWHPGLVHRSLQHDGIDVPYGEPGAPAAGRSRAQPQHGLSL